MTRSLATRDHGQARHRAVQAAARLQTFWQDVRKAMVARWKGKDIRALLPGDFMEDREQFFAFMLALPEADRKELHDHLRHVILASKVVLDRQAAEILEHRNELLQDRSDAQGTQLSVLQGQVQGLEKAINSLAATLTGKARSGIVEETPVLAARAAERADPRQQKPWSSFIDEFFLDARGLGASSKQSYNKAFADLKRTIGEKPIGQVVKANIKEYADYLRDKPIIRAGRTRLSRDTIIKMMSHIRSFFTWAVEAGIIKENPSVDVAIAQATADERDPKNKRRAFKVGELEILFNSPWYTGCESAHRRSEPGRTIIRDERYWFFLVALLSGARVEELAEAPARLAKIADIDCLDLMDAGTKTFNAPRYIPILPELKKLGFLDWAKSKEKEGFLFRGGGAFGDWSKGTNRYLGSIGLNDPTLVTYSLRHNFRQMMNGARLTLETADKIFGHGKEEGRTVGAGYGRDLSEQEARLFVQHVKSPIDLSHLYPISGQKA